MAETLTLVDTEGTTHALDGSLGIAVLYGATGRYSQPLQLTEYQLPGAAGRSLRSANLTTREVAVPLIVRGSTGAECMQRVRDLAGWVNGVRGDCKLRVTPPSGNDVELVARGAIELAEGADQRNGAPSWHKLALVLRATDPWWYDVADKVATFDITTGGGVGYPWFGRPWFPWRLTSSNIFAAATVTNDADAEAWPVWVITGPGSTIVLRNLTTDAYIALTWTLNPGEQITIDTRPGVKTLESSRGENLWSVFGAGGQLWPLAIGANAVQIEMSGSTADSRVTCTYRRRTLGPYAYS